MKLYGIQSYQDYSDYPDWETGVDEDFIFLDRKNAEMHLENELQRLLDSDEESQNRRIAEVEAQNAEIKEKRDQLTLAGLNPDDYGFKLRKVEEPFDREAREAMYRKSPEALGFRIVELETQD